METLLVSFIGKAREDKTGSRKYQKTAYKFPTGETHESTFFGMAALNYLLKYGYKPDMMVIGTKGSTWSELLEIIPETEESLALYEEAEKGINPNVIERIIELFKDYMGLNIFPILYEEDPPPQDIVAKHFLEKALDKPYEKVIIDITHSYRYMPYIILLASMILRHLNNSSIEILYGFFEGVSAGSEKPVFKLDILEELIGLSEALSIFQLTGNFREYFYQITDERDIREKAKKAYFKIETNDQPRQELRALLSSNGKYEKIHNYILDTLKAWDKDSVEDRMFERAKFFASKSQYFKAIVLMYEAIMLKIAKKAGYTNVMNYKEREAISERLNEACRSKLKDDNFKYFCDYFRLFQKIRNKVVHGTQIEGGLAGEANHYLSGEESILELFKNIEELYNKIDHINLNRYLNN
ncbi:MAG: TIGR02221 family CRISPR-associated protein [Hydrogenobaculum sp.]